MTLYVGIFFSVLFIAHIALQNIYKKNTASAENTTAEHQRLMQEYNKVISLISFVISVTLTLLIYFYFN